MLAVVVVLFSTSCGVCRCQSCVELFMVPPAVVELHDCRHVNGMACTWLTLQAWWPVTELTAKRMITYLSFTRSGTSLKCCYQASEAVQGVSQGINAALCLCIAMGIPED